MKNKLNVLYDNLQLVGEAGGGNGPGTIETRAVLVASTNSVSTDQGNGLLNSEAHTLHKNVKNVALAESTIG